MLQGHVTQSVRFRDSFINQSNAELKKNSSGWNISSDGEAQIISGSTFYTLAAAVGKAWLPSVAWRVDGTTSYCYCRSCAVQCDEYNKQSIKSPQMTDLL